MGALTAQQIITEGGLLAGRSDLSTRALSWLNTFLRAQYTAWPWPFLYKRTTDISVAAGTASFNFGAGANGETLHVQHIRDPVKMRTSDYSLKKIARIRQTVDGQPIYDPEFDESLQTPTTQRGVPEMFKVRASNTVGGQWALWPLPIPDRALLVTLDYLLLPADLALGGTPIYPADETLIHRVYARTLRYMGDLEAAAIADEEVRNMTINDRLKYGSSPGTGDVLQLDPGTFR